MDGEKEPRSPVLSRVLKNKHPAVSQGVRRFGKRSLWICEHLQLPHNAGSRREAPFFNTRIEQLYFTYPFSL
jgi:hypothetical protein